ncbi:MAG: TIGR01459 family HAD-type hydrolase [Hyphomicrobiaceae bacterium]|nr:TIGR01459 family HAD-type hydrolase [Hyphomicrobiaceae bacterium]
MSLRPPPQPIPILRSIEPIALDTEAWLVDIWGVMHNGVRPYPDAVDACRMFRSQGGLVLLLSNSPRRAAGVAAQLDQIGVAREAYDGIVSSGDATRVLISKLGGAHVFHLGPERDRPIFEGLPVTMTAAANAEAIVCTGLFDDATESPEDYAGQLAGFAARGIPMICANPDLMVERDGRIIWCAGGLAQAYEHIGGRVSYAGKPHTPIYDMAFAALAEMKGCSVARSRTLAIGDGIRTDIAGAVSNGLKAVYIASAVHLASGEALTTGALQDLFPTHHGRPVAAQAGLAW